MLSERTLPPAAVIRLMIGFLMVFCFTQALYVVLSSFGWFKNTGPEAKLLQTIIILLPTQIGAIGLVAWFVRAEKLTWASTFGLRRETAGRALVWGVVAGLLMIPTAHVLMQFSYNWMEQFRMHPESQDLVKTFQEVEKTGARSTLLLYRTLFGLSVIGLAPVIEEMFFRGLIYPTFKQLGFPRLSLWATCFLFALVHVNAPTLLSLIVLALVLTAVYEKTDNLLASIVTHSVFNAANFVFMIYEEPIRQWLK